MTFRSDFARHIFKQKYSHERAETWDELANTLATEVCQKYMTIGDITQLAQYISEMKFIPGGRYLYYAGRPNKFYNNCFIFKSQEDTREDWADTSWKHESALMTGGGTGNDFSVYRARGELLSSTGGVASGPIPKMYMINEIGRNVQQGGSRRSALYGSLNWRHADAMELIHAKDWDSMSIPGTGSTFGDAKRADFNFPCPLDMMNVSLNYDNAWRDGDRLTETFMTNVKMALRNGEPGFSFNFDEKEDETGRNACVSGETYLMTLEFGHTEIAGLVGKSVNVWNGENYESVIPYETGEQQLFKVSLSDGTHLMCTDNHKWVIGGKFVETVDLSVGDKLDKFDMPINRLISLRDVDVSAYSQGFYSGDGNKNRRFSWLYETKYMVEPQLIGELSAANGSRKRWLHGDMLAKDFVPINHSFDYKLSWLAGLLDSDGTVTRDKNGNGFQIGSINKEFLSDVQLMLTTIGVRAKIVGGRESGEREMPGGVYFCQKSYRLLIGNMDAYHLVKMGLPILRLKHNGQKPQRDARRFVTVDNVEETDRFEMTYCVTEPKTSRATFNGIVTGNCTEVTSADDCDVCNLGSINLSRIESVEELRDVIRLATMFLICGTLTAKMPFERIAKTREKNRRLGLGLMGVHEWLIQRGHRYEVVPELHEWLSVYRDESDKVSREFADWLNISRPVANRAIAPTGTIGIMAGTTTGIEPLFAVAYKRRYLKNGTDWHYQYEIDGTARELIDRYGADPEKIESAIDLAADPERRMAFQADVQDYVDMAISSTINLPSWGSELNNESTVKPFAELLAKYAPRLRGFTCYPDGARGGQPLTAVPYSDAVHMQGAEFSESYTDVCDLRGGGTCGL